MPVGQQIRKLPHDNPHGEVEHLRCAACGCPSSAVYAGSADVPRGWKRYGEKIVVCPPCLEKRA